MHLLNPPFWTQSGASAWTHKHSLNIVMGPCRPPAGLPLLHVWPGSGQGVAVPPSQLRSACLYLPPSCETRGNAGSRLYYSCPAMRPSLVSTAAAVSVALPLLPFVVSNQQSVLVLPPSLAEPQSAGQFERLSIGEIAFPPLYELSTPPACARKVCAVRSGFACKRGDKGRDDTEQRVSIGNAGLRTWNDRTPQIVSMLRREFGLEGLRHTGYVRASLRRGESQLARA